jgi:primosomal replication protein N
MNGRRLFGLLRHRCAEASKGARREVELAIPAQLLGWEAGEVVHRHGGATDGHQSEKDNTLKLHLGLVLFGWIYVA